MIRQRNLRGRHGVNMPSMRRKWLHSVVSVWLAGAVAGGGCHTTPAPSPPSARPVVPVVVAPPASAPAGSGGRATVTIDTGSDAGSLTATIASARSVSPDIKIATLTPAETQ